VAAALQFAAAVPNCNLAEYNPQVLTVANRFLVDPIEVSGTDYLVPTAPGLGIRFRETP
jgi:L-alanine-DL-glutamate epimerase-like enolase superfamily enzyme